MRAMAPTPSHAAVLAVVVLLAVAAAAAAAAVQAAPELRPDRYGWPAAAEGGGATVAPYCACAAAEECVVAGSAAARRELAGGGYISYDAMRRNSVPCSYRGASYYNCRPGGEANPYSRGCSAITQCRG